MGLTSEQQKIVDSKANKICIFACAGSGKTFTLTEKILSLIEDGYRPEEIAAITFTKLATLSLKRSLLKRLDPIQVSKIFIGTIHSFCLHLIRLHDGFALEEKVVITENQQYILLSHNYAKWHLDKLPGATRSQIIEAVVSSINIIKMESISDDALKGKNSLLFDIYSKYQSYLKENNFLDYSDLITDVYHLINSKETFRQVVTESVKYLFVDEYQDVDPLQANIIENISKTAAVCVVGDDDQSIYQFRGADVNNIYSFSKLPDCETFSLTTNRRCRANVLKVAANTAAKIVNRYKKEMNPLHDGGSVHLQQFETVQDEANFIVDQIEMLLDKKAMSSYGQVAILLRSVSSYGDHYINALKDRGIPITVRGAGGFLRIAEVAKIIQTLEWLIPEHKSLASLNQIEGLNIVDETTASEITLEEATAELLNAVGYDDEDVRLIANLIEINDRYQNNRFGSIQELVHLIILAFGYISSKSSETLLHNIGQFTAITAEYEAVSTHRRLQSFCNFLQNYGSESYDEINPVEVADNSVSVITIHQAKGLEYDYVFIPMLVDKRFPLESQDKKWLVNDSLFQASRYATTLDSERRLFYVASTRARNILYMLSSKDVGLVNPKVVSRFFSESLSFGTALDITPLENGSKTGSDEFLPTSYSALEYYLTCPYRYKLIIVNGIQSPKNPFFEFGKLIHYVVSVINSEKIDETRKEDALNLFIKHADSLKSNKGVPAYVLAKQTIRGRKAIENYIKKKGNWINNVYLVEEDFEFSDKDFLLRGRFDAICKLADDNYEIVDIKTGSPHEYLRTDFQMMLYSLVAVKQLGINIRRATLYYIEHDEEISYEVDGKFLENAELTLNSIVKGILKKEFQPTPGDMCTRCEMRQFCEFKK